MHPVRISSMRVIFRKLTGETGKTSELLMQAPIIIWTFRRTGGTNLAEALFNASQFTALDHEPFNLDRQFGYILERYNRHKNIDQLYIDFEEVLKNKYLIKHCMELFPKVFNAALMEVSIKYGYKHLFLYREQFQSRLLSLNFSIMTDIWGKGQDVESIDQSIFDTPIDIEEMVIHEKYCQKVMRYIYEALIELEQQPISVSFENLYRSDFEYSRILVFDIFNFMALDTRSLTEETLKGLLTGGAQGTNENYMRFPNAKEFVSEIAEWEDFNLHSHANRSPTYLTFGIENQKLELYSYKPAIYPNTYHLLGRFDVDLGSQYYVEWFGHKAEVIKYSKPLDFDSQNESSAYPYFVSKATKISGGVNIIMDYNVVARISY